MYCYEDKITDELIEVIATEDRICKYIDIPLQHVSDDVLKAMRRRSTSDSIRSTIGRLRSAVPNIHIRTTFITGFPGEREEDFEELADYVYEKYPI
jgi:ribosomal protein S12 methylthiotransferase